MMSASVARRSLRFWSQQRPLVQSRTAAVIHSRDASTLIVADPMDAASSSWSPATQAAVTAAHQWHPDHRLIVLVAAPTLPSSIPRGVSHVVHVTTDHLIAEPVARAIANTVQQASSGADAICHVVGASTKWGATVVPRAAALLQTSPVTDVATIVDERKWILLQCCSCLGVRVCEGYRCIHVVSYKKVISSLLKESRMPIVEATGSDHDVKPGRSIISLLSCEYA
jgi:hypothetical protein